MRRLWIVSHAHGAGDRFVDVWDRPAEPTADLVSKEPPGARKAAADGTFGDDAPTGAPRIG